MTACDRPTTGRARLIDVILFDTISLDFMQSLELHTVKHQYLHTEGIEIRDSSAQVVLHSDVRDVCLK